MQSLALLETGRDCCSPLVHFSTSLRYYGFSIPIYTPMVAVVQDESMENQEQASTHNSHFSHMTTPNCKRHVLNTPSTPYCSPQKDEKSRWQILVPFAIEMQQIFRFYSYFYRKDKIKMCPGIFKHQKLFATFLPFVPCFSMV